MNILVTGASGFVGSQIVTDLLNEGHEVTCCVRNLDYTRKLFPNTKILLADFTQDTSTSDWLPRLQGIDVVINTVGIFYHPNKQIIWKTHFEVPSALFSACTQSKVKKIIQISALGVDKYTMDYAKSKLAADEYLLKLSIPCIILRPSLIYGHGSYGGTSLFRGLSGLPFFIPLPNKGEQCLQPIYLPDLSCGIRKLISIPNQESMVFNAVCENPISLYDILKTLRQWLALPTAMRLPLPQAVISFIGFFGNFMPNSVINSYSNAMLMQNNTSSKEETEKFINAINFTPRNFGDGIFSQPSTVQDRWHARLYFVKPLLQYSLAFLWIFTAICSLWLYPQEASYRLLHEVGIPSFMQPIFLYGASLLDFMIGIALLIHFQIKKVCVLQFFIILLYTLIISYKLPAFWLHPFGPITKNLPLLVSIYILYILDTNR